jgi:hypothetical protein
MAKDKIAPKAAKTGGTQDTRCRTQDTRANHRIAGLGKVADCSWLKAHRKGERLQGCKALGLHLGEWLEGITCEMELVTS